MRLIRLFLLFLFFSQNSYSADYWITSNNTDVFNTKEWNTLSKISPKVQVFKFYYQVIQRMPTEQLHEVLAFLRKNNIRVAVEVPGLTWVDHGKGYAVEGFGPDFFHKDLANRVFIAGGIIDYIAIDEVVYYGHYYDGKNATHWDIPTIAKQTAENVKVYNKYFPNIKVGIIEPLSQIDTNDQSRTVIEFIKIFNSMATTPLSFIHYDVLWSSDVVAMSKKIQSIAKENNMEYGVIFNDNSIVNSMEWILNAKRNINSYFCDGAVTPDDIIVQSWNKAPETNFSLTDENALSTLVPFISTYLKTKVN